MYDVPADVDVFDVDCVFDVDYVVGYCDVVVVVVVYVDITII